MDRYSLCVAWSIIHVSIYLFDCYCLKFYHIIIKHLSSFVVCLVTAKLKKWTVILFVWHGLFLCIIHVSIYLFDCYCLKFYHIIIKHLSSFVVCLVDADGHWSWSMGGSLVV